jgi:hypothetical protein
MVKNMPVNRINQYIRFIVSFCYIVYFLKIPSESIPLPSFQVILIGVMGKRFTFKPDLPVCPVALSVADPFEDPFRDVPNVEANHPQFQYLTGMDCFVIEHAFIKRLMLFSREDYSEQVNRPEPFYRQIVGIDNFHTVDPNFTSFI